MGRSRTHGPQPPLPRRVPLASLRARPLAAVARAVKPPPPEPMKAAAEFAARRSGNQQMHSDCSSSTGSGSHGSSGGSGSSSAAATPTAASSASSSSAAAAAMAAAATCSVVASPQDAALAACTSSFQFQATAWRVWRRDSHVPWRSAVGRSRPTAALRARRCAHSQRSNHMPAMRCACY